MATAIKPIHPDNAYLVRQSLSKYDPVTNTYVAWTGASTIVVGFYEDELGVTGIAGLTGLAMTEGVSGVYYRVIDGTLTGSLAPTYVGDTIFQIVTGGALSDLRVVTPLLVTEPRYALLGE